MAQGTRVAGRYRLHLPISRGGLGTLWAATDERSGLPVSVRRLSRGIDDTDRVARFRASAVAAARLAHPNIAMVLDEGQDDDGPYIVSEWADGRPLSDWRAQRPSWAFLRPVLAQTCDALSYLHARGLVHLELRPEHLIIVQREHGPQVRMVDVGCARIDDGWSDRGAGAKVTLKYLGSVRYLAPEVAESPPWAVGPWSDIYSLGLVLWEMLTGSLPDGDLDGVALLLRRAASPTPRLPEGATDVHHHALRNLLKRLLAQDPRERPAAAQARRTLEAMGVDSAWTDPPPEAPLSDLTFDAEAAPAAGFPLLALRDGPLIGRRDPLHAAWRALQDTVKTGRSAAVLLAGPSGAGKSHLARMIVEHAQLRGTASSMSVRYEGGPAGSAVTRTLEDLLRAGDTDARGITARARRIDLLAGVPGPGFARVLPALLRPDPTPFARPGNEPEPGLDFESGDASDFVVAAFREIVRQAAVDRVVIVWLDDLHLASEAEGPALADALLNDDVATVFVIATVRDDQSAALRARFDGPQSHWLELPNLGEEALRTYVRARLTPDRKTEDTLVAALRREPARLRSLTDFVLTGRLMLTDEGNALLPGVLLPESDDELYESLLAALPTGRADTLVPDIVAGLALSRVPLGPAVIHALEAVDPNRPFARALAAAERARMMYRRPSGGWHFTSEGLRQWLIGYGEPRAESWHRRWLRALSQLEGRARGRYGLERAAHAESLDECTAALDALLEACAWSLGPGQQALAQGLEAAEQARRLALEQGDPISRARAARLRADISRQMGDQDAARQALNDAEGALDSALDTVDDPIERGWCALARGWLLLDQGELPSARQRFQHARGAFESAIDAGGVLWARLGLARLDSLEGRHGAARAAAREVELGFTKLGAKRGVLAARMLRASAADRAGDWSLAEERYAVVQKMADQHHWLIESTTLRLRRARLLLELGRAHDALKLIDEAGQVAQIAGLSRISAWVYCVRPAALAAAGDIDAAVAALNEARLPEPGARKSAAAALRAALSQPSAQLDRDVYAQLSRWSQHVAELSEGA